MREILKSKEPIDQLREVMTRLRAPDGCPWDQKQDHMSIRHHAVEEVYEMIDAIEAQDDKELKEELGDVLLQVIFHCQLAKERNVFDFNDVSIEIVEKLIRRHPHVFGDDKSADNTEKVLSQWEAIKKAEKEGTEHQRDSVFDGIPNHLPALAKAEKLIKKARKSQLWENNPHNDLDALSNSDIANNIFQAVSELQSRGASAELLLREKIELAEKELRQKECSKFDQTS